MDLWKQYDEAVGHWRPTFGKQAHIDAVERIAAIVRLRKSYDAAQKKRDMLRMAGKQLRESKVLTAQEKEISQLIKSVLPAIL